MIVYGLPMPKVFQYEIKYSKVDSITFIFAVCSDRNVEMRQSQQCPST